MLFSVPLRVPGLSLLGSVEAVVVEARSGEHAVEVTRDLARRMGVEPKDLDLRPENLNGGRIGP